MSKPEVRKLTEPQVIPVEEGKTIEEFVGLASNGLQSMSVAHMIAPPGWHESWQQPAFHEVTIVVSGQMAIEHEDGVMVVGPGEVALAEPGARVRYSNPFDRESEYWAVCSPAFTVDAAGRD